MLRNYYLLGDQLIAVKLYNQKILTKIILHSKHDPQQLARKRHIGNDIVCLVFQEADTVFSPDIISSQFLHAFIIVRPVSGAGYRFSVVTKADVADFAPLDLSEGLHPGVPEVLDQLVTKLINAEQACYRSSVFLGLEQRTRLSMLAQVSDTLVSDSNKFLQPATSRGNSVDENALNGKEKGLLSNVRSLLTKRSRSRSFLSPIHSQDSKEKEKSLMTNSLVPPPNPAMYHGKHKNLSTGSYLFSHY